jgi:urocanate hydratase
MTAGAREVRAPRGTELSCKGWQQEAALAHADEQPRPEVAERPTTWSSTAAPAARRDRWEAFDAIVRELRRLEGDETLLIQSGKPVGVVQTHEWAPRVLIANSNLVPSGRLGRVPSARGARLDDVRAR